MEMAGGRSGNTIIDVQQLTACAVGTADRSAISFTHKEIRYSVEITDLSWHYETLLATNDHQ